jgi:hypothetical protein
MSTALENLETHRAAICCREGLAGQSDRLRGVLRPGPEPEPGALEDLCRLLPRQLLGKPELSVLLRLPMDWINKVALVRCEVCGRPPLPFFRPGNSMVFNTYEVMRWLCIWWRREPRRHTGKGRTPVRGAGLPKKYKRGVPV